ncbi:MAG: outer membrane lipoprotein carrier protein LolA [Crocinitomicaceae bacterium]
MKNLTLLSICFFLFSTSMAQTSKSQVILDKLSGSMKKLSTFYVEFNANIKNTSTGVNESEKGKGWVKGDKYYATYGEITLLSNGVKTWTVINEEKSVYVSDANDGEESMNPKKLMTIWESGFKNTYEKSDVLNGENIHIIKLYPKQPDNADYHTILLYVSVRTSELKKVIMKTNDGTIMTYHLTKFISNKEIADSKFSFNKAQYPGYTVIRD